MDNDLRDFLKDLHQELHTEVREIRKEIVTIDKVLAINTASLEEHHKRTTIAEERLKWIEKYIQTQVTSVKVIAVIGMITLAIVKSPIVSVLKTIFDLFH